MVYLAVENDTKAKSCPTKALHFPCGCTELEAVRRAITLSAAARNCHSDSLGLNRLPGRAYQVLRAMGDVLAEACR
jgi:hypothetical protein